MPPTTDISSFTDEQKILFSKAASLGSGVQTNLGGTTTQLGGTGPIGSQSLTPQPSYDFTSPQITPTYPVSGLNVTDLTPTPQEQKASSLTDSLTQLNEQLLGESQLRGQLEQQQGLPELQRTQTDLTSRLNTLKNEALAIPLQLQQEATGRSITAGGLQPIQTAALRNNAIQALSTSSLLEASRGNITLAQDLVDRAVAQRFDPIREQIDAATKNLELILNDPRTSLQDKNRAAKQKARQDALAAQAEKDALNQKSIYDIAITAAKYGADPATLDRIMKSPDRGAALIAGGQFLQDPKAQYELESARLDNALKQAQISKVARETTLLGKATATELKEQRAALKTANASLPAMFDKVATADALKTHNGLGAVVGPNFFGRIGTTYRNLTGEAQEFISGVSKLVNGMTLQNLIDAKGQGATFGALSDAELKLLASSASKISTWEIKDSSGNVTGYSASEGAFKQELDNIKMLTNRAILLKQGDLFDEDETSQLDEVFGESAIINPSSYY